MNESIPTELSGNHESYCGAALCVAKGDWHLSQVCCHLLTDTAANSEMYRIDLWHTTAKIVAQRCVLRTTWVFTPVWETLRSKG